MRIYINYDIRLTFYFFWVDFLVLLALVMLVQGCMSAAFAQGCEAIHANDVKRDSKDFVNSGDFQVDG